MKEVAGGIDDQLVAMFRRAAGRKPGSQELAVLRALREQQLALFQKHPENAAKFLAIGDLPRALSVNAVELAAMTVVAEALLSYDETITKR